MPPAWSQFVLVVPSPGNMGARWSCTARAPEVLRPICPGNRLLPEGWLAGVLVADLPSLVSNMRTRASTRAWQRTQLDENEVPRSVSPSSAHQGWLLLTSEEFNCSRAATLFSRWSGVLRLSPGRCGFSKAEEEKNCD